MKLQQVRQCCCGASLELGTKIIAWLQIVGATIYTILSIVGVFASYSSTNWELFIAETFLGYLSSGLYQIGFGVVLLMGVKRTRPDYVNVWIISFLFGIVIFIINFFIEFVVTMLLAHVERAEIIIGIVFVSIIALALDYYCLIVVYSFRKEILSGNVPVRLQEV